MIIGLERIMRGRARFGEAAGAAAGLGPVASRACERGPPLPSAASCCSCVLGPDSPARVVGIPEITGPRGTPNTERFLEFLGNSLQLALLTAVVCVLASIFIANGSRFVSGRTTGLAARLTAVGYAVPGPVVAMGVVLSLVALDDVLEGIGLGLPGTVATGSLVGLVYAYSIRFLAPGLNAIEAGMAQVPEEITASARSLGARPATIVRRIHTPLARTSVATGAVLVAVDA